MTGDLILSMLSVELILEMNRGCGHTKRTNLSRCQRCALINQIRKNRTVIWGEQQRSSDRRTTAIHCRVSQLQCFPAQGLLAQSMPWLFTTAGHLAGQEQWAAQMMNVVWNPGGAPFIISHRPRKRLHANSSCLEILSRTHFNSILS